jgi:hypothetical protein
VSEPEPRFTLEASMIDDHDLAGLLLGVSAVLLTTTIVFGAMWLRARERRLRDSLAESPRVDHSVEIKHLVDAVDSIAVEVERISEAQRFTTQLLADRALNDTTAQKRVPSPGRVITPH